MMKITVKFFASLREEIGQSQTQIHIETPATVIDVWQHACPNIPLQKNILIAINLEYVTIDAQVKDGDEVAFFPPVTGG